MASPIAEQGADPASEARRTAGLRTARFAARPGRAVLLLLLEVLAAPACRPGPPPARNLLLVSLDTTRRDHLSTYGYSRKTTRALDTLARGGAIFENAISQATNTNPSHASIFTGLYPHVHGNRFNGQILPRDRRTLAEILGHAGFSTAGFVSGATLRSETSGLDQGFALYDDGFSGVRRPGAETTRRAVDWLRARAPGERSFCFLHLFDAHGPYRPPRAYARLFRSAAPGPAVLRIPGYQQILDSEGRPQRHLATFIDRYDGLIRYLDDRLAAILREVDLGRTLVVVLADHGETLGERYHMLDHGGQVFDEQVRIPLVIRAPGYPPRRIEEQVEAVDVLPTVLELLGVEWAPGPPIQGRSLVPLLRGEPGGRELAFSSARAARAERYGGRGYALRRPALIHSVRSRRWKLVLYPGVDGRILELYDLEADPREERNLANRDPVVRDRYLHVLSSWLAIRDGGRSAEAKLSEGLREQLRALGYADD